MVVLECNDALIAMNYCKAELRTAAPKRDRPLAAPGAEGKLSSWGLKQLPLLKSKWVIGASPPRAGRQS